MSEPNGYSRLQIALHWAIALFILAAWLQSDGMGGALVKRMKENVTGFSEPTLHTMFGGTVFVLVLIRIVVRLRTGAPEPQGSPMVVLAAKWGHRLLYLLMIVVPAMGAASWYGHLHDLGHKHATAGNVLMIVALGHALAALYHHYGKKDGTLSRMLRPGAP